ncbi:MAG: hypothetical protein L6R19_23120 [Alphaproteobacteria bacterium]|nr:hypothetical protein [Alphaproteobacteria bacterium]
MQSPIRIETEEAVWRIVPDRSERAHALDQSGREGPIEPPAAAAAGDRVRAVAITGAGHPARAGGAETSGV